MNNSAATHINKGYFGKYGNYGDYVQHGLPPALIECWSDWCQRCLVGMKKAFKHNWTHYYLQSPIWTFVLYDPKIYSAPLVGLLTPNQDNQGRYFPLTFIQAMTPGTLLLKTLLDNQESWNKLESFAFSTRGKAIADPQILADQYNRLAPLQFKEQTEEAARLEQYGPYGASGLLSSATYQDPEVIHILDRCLSSGTQAISYWFARVDEIDPCLASFNGLPEPEEFAWMLGRYEPEEQL